LAALSEPHEWIALSLIAMASVTSGISVFREHSWRRWLSVFVFIGSVALLAYLIWTSSMLAKMRSPENKSKATINQKSDDTSMIEGDTSAPVIEGDSSAPESGEQAPQSRRPRNSPTTSPEGSSAPTENANPTKTDNQSDGPDTKAPVEGDGTDMPPPDGADASSTDPADTGSGEKPTQAAVEKP
jgi:cytoskeletal protein RodZ